MKIFRIFLMIFISSLILSACDNYKPDYSMDTAIRFGDEKAVKYYIKKGESVNQIDNFGTPLISVAAEKGSISIMKQLINAGANVNVKDKYSLGYTPLMTASQLRNGELVDILIKAGADVNAKDDHGYTALMHANGFTVDTLDFTARILIEAGADVNAKNNFGDTALILACNDGVDVMKVKLLIDAGADVNTKGKDGVTALMNACYAMDVMKVKLLIDAGADVNAKDKEGSTALQWAHFKYTRIANMLIKAGAKK